MKFKIIIMSIMLFVSTLSIACSGGPRGSGNKFKGMLVEELNLSDEQQQQFEEVMDLKRQSTKEAMEQIHLDTKVQLEEFLSREQLQLLEEKKQNRMNRKGKYMFKRQ